MATLKGDDDYDCNLDLIHRDMFSASIFQTEKKSTITEISQILNNSLTTCFTVCFNATPDQKSLIA